MRKLLIAFVAAVAATLIAVPAAASARSNPVRGYLVLYEEGASLQAARSAVRQVGGRIVRENKVVGLATVRTRQPRFLRLIRKQDAVAGAARNRTIGRAYPGAMPARQRLERVQGARRASMGTRGRTLQSTTRGVEPLGGLQWHMHMIQATPGGSYAVERGDRRVLVGVIDTGIDGGHPDIAPNFHRGLSRNFTRDMPLVDGPCEEEPDGSCSDPPDVDENGHGTHVAGTIAAPLNGLGTAGVAPNVTLVNLRAGQDSGYFFLQPTLAALVYAGNAGIDVANMSFYIDPWLYNCGPDNPALEPETGEPADSRAEQLEQQVVIEATQRAVDFARERGVTLVGAAGNSAHDLDNRTFDETSPDFPPGVARPRIVSNECLDMPTEADGVLSIASIGPTKRKAYYSNYGESHITVSAPGGDFRDFFGTDRYRSTDNLVLAPYPEQVARDFGEIDENGFPTTPFVIRNCGADGRCGYYTYFQGTSMAAPHAAGVAALIVSRFGTPVADGRGLTMDPDRVETRLRSSATNHACPMPRLFIYPDLPVNFDAFCGGSRSFNGFYGDGIVNALAAVGSG